MIRVRNLAPFVALFLAGVLVVVGLLTMIRLGVAHAAPVAVDAATVAHDAAPQEVALDDAEAARRIGWPVGVFAIVTVLALSLGRAGVHLHVPWLAWLARGTAATVLGAVAAGGSAVVEVAALGGSPVAMGTAAVTAILAFWRARRPEPTSATRPLRAARRAPTNR
jgi:hypothetical protein